MSIVLVHGLWHGRCGATVVWPTGHSPFLSRPDLVTGLVLDTI